MQASPLTFAAHTALLPGRLVLQVEYDGHAFCGWQSQPSGCGVQDHLQAALTAIAGEPIVVSAAGRTDAGVHATAQVVHFDSPVERPASAWVRGVNAHLPPAVAVRWVQPVPADFHARFSAMGRRYRYVLFNHPLRPALLAGKVGWFHVPLDEVVMQQALACLIGTHDFSSFRAAECQAKSPVKTLTDAKLVRQGDYLLLDLRADGFLHHMVRNIVGALVFIGKGAQPASWMAELLAACDRTQAAPMFAPDGLYLTGVDYSAEWLLPQSGRIMALPAISGA